MKLAFTRCNEMKSRPALENAIFVSSQRILCIHDGFISVMSKFACLAATAVHGEKVVVVEEEEEEEDERKESDLLLVSAGETRRIIFQAS